MKRCLFRSCGVLGVVVGLIGTGEAWAGQKTEATDALVMFPGQIVYRAHELFAQKVAEKTKGGLTIKLVGSGQMGGIKENLEAIQAGNLEIAFMNNANLSTLHPNTMLFDLPFIFRDNDHMMRVVRGPIGKQVYAEYEKKTGVKLLMTGMMDGERSVWNAKRPVRTPEDVKGMKVRVMENPIMVDTFRALGALPTPMPSTEMYMAAKQGVIDGGELPPTSTLMQKLYEPAKYYSYTRHFNMPASAAVSAKWFFGLPAEYQKAVLEAAVEAVAWHDKMFAQDEQEAVEKLKSFGMQFNTADQAAFQKMMKPVYDKYADKVGGWKMIQAVIDTK